MRYIKLMTCMTTAMMLVLFTALTAVAADPAGARNDSWITFSGTVEEVQANSFLVDYGDGKITVEMDDGDRDADGYKLVKGDEVTVSGRVDDDVYEKRTIEASSVYVEKLNTYFYASPADEEDFALTYYGRVEYGDMILRGVVTDIVGDEEFKLDTGLREVIVEVDELPFNPLDNEGYQRIDVGDVVSVTGNMDEDLFEGREFVADSVMTIAE